MTSKWTVQDIQKMNEMVADKRSFTKIAKELGRSPLAVKYKFGRQYRKKIRSKIEISNTDSFDSSDNSDESPRYNTHTNHTSHKRTYSSESDPSIYVRYSSPVSICTLVGIVAAGTLSIVIGGTYVYMGILLDSIGRIVPT